MKLASRMLFVVVAVVVLSATAFSQTLRPETDPRNISPTVGTGGTPGGPTGLFTIYDGDTLRKGEFTFSIAYSNWDRDPGNVDLTEVPLSFQIGINDHLELFFTTDGYRKVNAHNPQNLSGFYLPNTPDSSGCARPAIILPPTRVSGSTALTGLSPLARPSCNQPFVAFPFIGGTGPNFGLTGNGIAPPFVSTLGPFTGGGTGSFGAAGNFGGVGSAFGSILPGIVLTTRTIPPNLTFNTLTVPDLYTTMPSYLPDAPFLGRLDEHTSFGTFNVGAKIRFTGPTNPLGVGLVAFWRFYLDKPNDAEGFEQLQRGSSPGGSIGDFGLVGFVSGRLSRSVNLSANFGYILNSNPRSDAFGGEKITLLDRPDEFVYGLGFDFPINKHVQPILELKGIRYVGGRTPNAFENHPLDFLGGVKFYPKQWIGFGASYRAHLNQQGKHIFGGSQDFPAGFTESDDPNGFILQFWAGRRNPRTPAFLPNQPPTVTLAASSSTITLPCAAGTHSSGACPSGASSSVQLTANATDPDGDTLLYTYSTTGGRVSGQGGTATWDLSGLGPGTYTASVDVDDGCGCITSSTTTVTIASCSDCVPDVVCPQISSSCPDAVDQGQPITFTATVGPGTPPATSYNWTVSAGTITSGQGTTSITVSTDNIGGQSVTATLEVGGVDPSCGRTTSCTTAVRTPARPPRKFDEYGNIRFNDEKARLDNFAVQLQQEPGATGYIIGYGSCDAEGQARASRAKDYLVNTRGVDAGRIMVVDGGCLPELQVQLWIAPQGATPPTGDAAGVISPCPECKKKATRRRRRGRGE
ncbi:MAG TPA: hypothetical protein VNG71_02160 [Pyrinomonadaceae bacterium]|nr:hypothetical protein [Pyrinomonadaceae bacterium]